MVQVHLESMAFDSDLFAAAEQFQRYVEANRGGAIAREAGPKFRARVQRWRLDRCVLHERRLNDVVHERGAELIQADRVDHLLATLVIAGEYRLDTGAGLVPVLPGQIALVDMTEPMRTSARDAHVVTVSVARDLMLSAGGRTEGLHGRVIGAEAAGLFADFLLSAVRRAPQLTVNDAPAVVRALVTLLAGALDLSSQAHDPARNFDADDARFDRACRLIEQQLGDPSFGPAALVAQLGVSRATLYRLFHAHGGLGAFIQARRLDRVRVALSPGGDKRSLEEIATDAGFVSDSHCSRLFLEAYGARPSDYRAQAAADAAAGGADARTTHWIRDLS